MKIASGYFNIHENPYTPATITFPIIQNEAIMLSAVPRLDGGWNSLM